MKIVEVKIYSFNELSKEAQQKAIEKFRYYQVEDNWWECTYDDAAEIGLKITSFDLDRNKHAKGEFTKSFFDVIDAIKTNHGESCETYKLAIGYETTYNNLVHTHSDGISTEVVSEENEQSFDECADELESEFLNDLLECYADMLQEESEYLVSDECVTEFIESNDYEFTEEGNRY